MGYGLAHGFEAFVKALQKVVLQCIVTCMSQWVYEGGEISNGLDYGICGRRKDFLRSLTFMKTRL